MSVRSSATSRVSVNSQKSESSWLRNNPKSSAFYPVAMSPTARYNIMDHMNSHYKRIQTVKAVVDTSPPKSYQLRHSPSQSRRSSRPNSRSSCETCNSRYTQVSREVLQTTSKINYYLEALRQEQERLTAQVTSHLYFQNPVSRSRASTESLRRPLKIQKPSDLIDKNSNYFTPSEPFTPRVLRTNAKPKLSEYRWYNPSRRKDIQAKNDFGPVVIKNTTKRRLLERTDSDCYESWTEDPQADSDRYLSSDSVQQSTRASSQESLHSSNTHHSYNSMMKNGSSVPSLKDAEQHSTRGRKDINIKLPGSKSKENDEHKYLEFVVDITNDILLRGIYSNNVLKTVFRSHMERRRKDLSMEKMMEALRQLKIDLGIDDEDDALNGEMLGFHSSDRQLKPKAQWQNGHYVSSIENSLESPSFVVNAGSSLHNRPPVLDISPRIVAHAENRTTLENSAVSELKESLADVSYDDKVVHSSRSNSLAPASGSTNKSVLNGTYNKEPQIFDASSEEDLPYFEEMKKDTSIS